MIRGRSALRWNQELDGSARPGEVRGIFQPAIRELKETDYQRQRPYILDDSATHTTFGLEPTPWAEIIDALEVDYRWKLVG